MTLSRAEKARRARERNGKPNEVFPGWPVANDWNKALVHRRCPPVEELRDYDMSGRRSNERYERMAKPVTIRRFSWQTEGNANG